MNSKDRDPNEPKPEAISLTVNGSLFDGRKFPSGTLFFKRMRGNQYPTPVEKAADVLLPAPEKVVSPAPEEEYRARRPSRRIPVEDVRPSVEAQHRARGRQRFQLSQRVLRGAAAILTVGSIYLAREPLSEAAASSISFVADGLINQPGLQAARKSYSRYQAYANLNNQLDNQRNAAKEDSKAIRAALDRQQIKDQIEFLLIFGEGIDKIHGNSTAGDSHRLEAARLQTLLDK